MDVDPGLLCELIVVNFCSVIWHPERTDKAPRRHWMWEGAVHALCSCGTAGSKHPSGRGLNSPDVQAAWAVTSALPSAPSLHANLSSQL